MAIASVKALINGQEVTLDYNASTGKYEKQVTAPSASSFAQSGGYYPVTVTATDTAGNSTTVNDTDATVGNGCKLFVEEKVAPTISITSPAAGAHITSNAPTVTFSLLDNANGQASGFSGIDTSTCVVKLDGVAVSGTPTFTAATGGYTGSLALASLADGSHTITIDVADNDGNSATQASCTFVVDTVAPALNVTAPTDGSETNNTACSVVGSTNDVTSSPVTVTIKLNGADQGAVTVDGSGNFSKALTLAANQSNVIVVRATDTAGKYTERTINVVHNGIAPVIKSVVISPNPVAAGSTYTISVEVE